MDWYKHSTDSHDDPDISDAMDEFGPAGYSAFFIILELYGKEYNHVDSEGKIKLSINFLKRKLRLSSTKVEQILNFYSERQRIIAKIEHGNTFIYCPKFIDIASNWIKRKTSTPTEGLQRAYVAPTAKEVEVEKEEEKNKNKKKKEDLKPLADTPKKLVSPEGSDHQTFITYAFDSFRNVYGEKMMFDGGKDGAIVKKLLNVYGLERLKELWNVFMQSKDPFIVQAGYSIGVFKSVMNKLISGKAGPQIPIVTQKTAGNWALLKAIQDGEIGPMGGYDEKV